MKTLIFTIFFIALGYFSSQKEPTASVLLEENFEDKRDLYESNWWNRSGNDKALIQDLVSREGNKAARFEVELTEDGDFRSELAVAEGNPSPRHYQMGQEYWYGFSIYPEKNMVTSPVSEIVLQFHSTPDNIPGETWSSGLNPPIALACNGARWQLTVRGDDKQVTTKPDYLFETTADLGPAQQGQWTDWVFNIKWNYDGNGFLKIWKNGKMVYYLESPNTFNDKKGPYLKLGVYAFYLRRPGSDYWLKAKAAGVNQRIYCHDALRIVNSSGDCNQVSPADRDCESENAVLKINWKTIAKKENE